MKKTHLFVSLYNKEICISLGRPQIISLSQRQPLTALMIPLLSSCLCKVLWTNSNRSFSVISAVIVTTLSAL